jgi:hypothetical protein
MLDEGEQSAEGAGDRQNLQGVGDAGERQMVSLWASPCCGLSIESLSLVGYAIRK